MTSSKSATLYRMVMPEHICPFGLKAYDLLAREGFDIDDRHLTSKAEDEEFKSAHHVKTTPQVFISGKRIGGYDDLQSYLGKSVPKAGAVSYWPVAGVVSVAALMAIAASWAAFGKKRDRADGRMVHRVQHVRARHPQAAT